MQQFECFFIKTTAIFQSYRFVPRKVSRMEVASPTVSLRSDRLFLPVMIALLSILIYRLFTLRLTIFLPLCLSCHDRFPVNPQAGMTH